MRIIPSDIDEIFMLLLGLAFLVINYSMNISNTYLWLTVIWLLLYILPFALKNVYPAFNNLIRDFYPVEKNEKGRILSLVIAVVVSYGFIFINSGLNLAAKLTFATAPLPILANAELLTKLFATLLIATVETMLFFRMVYAWALWLIGKSDRDNIFELHQIIAIIFVAGLFALFHLTSHGLNNIGMIATFAFGVISLILINITKQTREALLFHIIVNGIAVGLIPVIF